MNAKTVSATVYFHVQNTGHKRNQEHLAVRSCDGCYETLSAWWTLVDLSKQTLNLSSSLVFNIFL